MHLKVLLSFGIDTDINQRFSLAETDAGQNSDVPPKLVGSCITLSHFPYNISKDYFSKIKFVSPFYVE